MQFDAHLPKPHARIERGASAVEYALLAAGIAAVIVVILVVLGGEVFGLFDETCDELSKTRPGSADCTP
ncbi:Flp family type IVb pilin [Nocardioides sp. R-C-SC26]|uniref:Flp family type IVb pilin n=1 Tax=Nocardioides sp. R-C-SC26 TaxID=2870414 RepID=UPI001E4B5F81|nr:Flp family type IVb pilin [Nocardioides sp. R-C-SC26]